MAGTRAEATPPMLSIARDPFQQVGPHMHRRALRVARQQRACSSAADRERPGRRRRGCGRGAEDTGGRRRAVAERGGGGNRCIRQDQLATASVWAARPLGPRGRHQCAAGLTAFRQPCNTARERASRGQRKRQTLVLGSAVLGCHGLSAVRCLGYQPPWQALTCSTGLQLIPVLLTHGVTLSTVPVILAEVKSAVVVEHVRSEVQASNDGPVVTRCKS